MKQTPLLPALLTTLVLGLPALGTSIPAAAGDTPIHHVSSEVCKSCHQDVYRQWKGSMHAQSTALEDPIHATFYKMVIGDPTQDAGILDFRITSDAGSTILIKDGNTVIDTFTSTGTDVRTLTLAEGSHLLSAEVTDTAGNVSAQSEELVVTVDRTAPTDPGAPDLLASSDTGDRKSTRLNSSH